MKYMEFHKDLADRVSQAWVDSDIRRVKEIKEVQKSLPPKSRKKPHKESFHVESTKLNLKACPSEDYPKALKTEQLEEALAYISRMHRTDAELQAMGASTSTPPPSQE
jgi:hypothetical protein